MRHTLGAHIGCSNGWNSLKQKPFFLDGLSMTSHTLMMTVPTQLPLLWVLADLFSRRSPGLSSHQNLFHCLRVDLTLSQSAITTTVGSWSVDMSSSATFFFSILYVFRLSLYVWRLVVAVNESLLEMCWESSDIGVDVISSPLSEGEAVIDAVICRLSSSSDTDLIFSCVVFNVCLIDDRFRCESDTQWGKIEFYYYLVLISISCLTLKHCFCYCI